MITHNVLFCISDDFNWSECLVGIDDEYRLSNQLIEFGKMCLDKNETGLVFPHTIVPLKKSYTEEEMIQHIEDVITANELYIRRKIISFPLLKIKRLPCKNWCCFAHYYESLLEKALINKGYYRNSDNKKSFQKKDGESVIIKAETGI